MVALRKKIHKCPIGFWESGTWREKHNCYIRHTPAPSQTHCLSPQSSEQVTGPPNCLTVVPLKMESWPTISSCQSPACLLQGSSVSEVCRRAWKRMHLPMTEFPALGLWIKLQSQNKFFAHRLPVKESLLDCLHMPSGRFLETSGCLADQLDHGLHACHFTPNSNLIFLLDKSLPQKRNEKKELDPIF